MSNLIGISGKKGAGKDEVALIFQFISHIKEICPTPEDRILWEEEHEMGIFSEESYNEYLHIGVDEHLHTYSIVKFADKLKDIVCLLIGCTREQLEDQKFKETPLGKEWWKWELIPNDETIVPTYLDYLSNKSFFKDNSEIYVKVGGTIELIKLTPRLLLQLLGTECGRNIIHPDIWVNSTFSNFNAEKDELSGTHFETFKQSNWLITDTRFPNEVKAIRDRKGIVIRVNGNFNKIQKTQKMLSKIDNIISTEHKSETALDDYDDWDYVIDNNGTIGDLITKVKKIHDKCSVKE